MDELQTLTRAAKTNRIAVTDNILPHSFHLEVSGLERTRTLDLGLEVDGGRVTAVHDNRKREEMSVRMMRGVPTVTANISWCF